MLVNWHEEYAKVMTFIIVFRKFLHNFFVSFRISFAFVIDEREKCETTKKNQNIASKNTFIFYESSKEKFMQDVLNGRENCKRVTHNGRNEVCY